MTRNRWPRLNPLILAAALFTLGCGYRIVSPLQTDLLIIRANAIEDRMTQYRVDNAKIQNAMTETLGWWHQYIGDPVIRSATDWQETQEAIREWRAITLEQQREAKYIQDEVTRLKWEIGGNE